MSDPVPSTLSTDRLSIGYQTDDATAVILAGMKRKLDEDDRVMTQDEKEDVRQREAKRQVGEDMEPVGDLEKRKIYAGSLAPSVDEKQLTLYFTVFGRVLDCKVIRDRESGISKGFAFVTFLGEEQAEAAIAEKRHNMNGKDIRVSSVLKQGETPAGGAGRWDKDRYVRAVPIKESKQTRTRPARRPTSYTTLTCIVHVVVFFLGDLWRLRRSSAKW
jgi:cold-inducible RNA-binding protein